MIKTFKGLIADDGIQKIRLSTNDGLTGYRLTKLQLMFANPGTQSTESVVSVFTVPQDTALGTVNFDNPTLVATAFLSGSTSATYPEDITVVIDHVTINQDIYITHVDNAGVDPVNYYLELEQVKLDVNEASVATLKDMRGRE